MAHNTQALNLFGGGDPIPNKAGMSSGMAAPFRQRTPLDDTADIRDSITGLIGKGYTSVSDDEARGHFARLAGLLGQGSAQKLLTNIFLHNKSPNVAGKGLEDRVNYFYDTNFNDPEIDALVKRAKNFGSGPISGLNNSPDLTNMQISNRFNPTGALAGDPSNIQNLISNVIK